MTKTAQGAKMTQETKQEEIKEPKNYQEALNAAVEYISYNQIYNDLIINQLTDKNIKKLSEKEIIEYNSQWNKRHKNYVIAFEIITKEINNRTDMLQRLQAEFENYRKRIEKENQENIKYANKNLILKILPTLDTFDLAFKYKDKNEEFIKGIEIVKEQLIQTLEKEGIKKIESKGKYNPELHEPLLAEESKEPKETILEELQKGYTLNNKVIRQAKVKISK